MKLKALMAALALTLASAMALANGCGWKEKTAQQCGEGQFYDADKGACVDQVTG